MADPSAAAYLRLTPAQWRERLDFFRATMTDCELCPRRCRARRTEGQVGFCGQPAIARVASTNLHHGEEPPISGFRGSGTVFFSGCTLRCLFCQNYPISQLGHGRETTVDGLARAFLSLQRQGAHNINLVSPTPHLPSVVAALAQAAGKGLTVPVLLNTSGYERVEVVAALEDLVDIYLPDVKYAGGALAGELSGATDYPEADLAAVGEMVRQRPGLVLDEQEIAVRGTILRHLILPGEVENSLQVLERIAGHWRGRVYFSLMSQYFPAHRAVETPRWNRRLTAEEYRTVRDRALGLGLDDGWFQEL